MELTLFRDRLRLHEDFLVPASKSIANRLLIIRALSGSDFAIRNLSTANDTILLQKLLAEIKDCDNEKPLLLDAKDAGTVFRFLTAYLSLKGTNTLLTGSARMQQRPVGDLVGALRKLGAKITYEAKEGYPPLQISGAPLISKETLAINAGISSQFISALLLIAPYVKEGITLQLENTIVSEPYIEMTISLMQAFGVSCERGVNTISVAEGKYAAHDFSVESDWSGASYGYAWSMLMKKKLRIPYLFENSLQGDAVIAELMQDFFGIKTSYFTDDILIDPSGSKLPAHFSYDFTACPDLAPTMVCLCAVLGIEAEFSGVANLAIKESDRMQVLKEELLKVGSHLEGSGGYWYLHPGKKEISSMPVFDTHEDHRIAMSLAFFAVKHTQVKISGAECVKKSFPGYFDLLQ